MILMTDRTGCTFIYSEERIMCMARQQSLRRNVMNTTEALDILNANARGEVWQQDSEYIEGLSDAGN